MEYEKTNEKLLQANSDIKWFKSLLKRYAKYCPIHNQWYGNKYDRCYICAGRKAE
jgi:hypothetical protein